MKKALLLLVCFMILASGAPVVAAEVEGTESPTSSWCPPSSPIPILSARVSTPSRRG